MRNIKQQLKKGVLEIAIMGLLNDRDYYGYQLINDLREHSNGIFDIKEGTAYPILYRLEDNKLISSYWETDDNSRSKPRKYYCISDKGRELLIDSVQEFREISQALNNIIG